MEPDARSLEMGVKFTADTSGYITGVRFYKYAQNTGTHIGHLWTTSGTSLGSVTFTSETASGWQQANFATPIAITAGTTYIASYFSPTGYYAVTAPGFTTGVDNAPLHALANSTSGGNGVFRFSSTSTFPSQTYQAANFWVDVVFTTATADTTPPTITAVTPAASATNVATSTTVTATFSEAMNASTITTSTMTLRDPTNSLVPASVTYASGTATLTPTAPLAAATTYVATVTGGAAGVTDVAGNPLAASVGWSFTTASASTTSYSIWTPATTPGPMEPDPSSIELGFKFTADTAGYITGLRFYKYAQNTGTHTGHLWTTAGALLGSVTFTNETASGWQQANFATPIAISAGTTYVASYFTPTGYYAVTDFGFNSAVNSPPLHALASSTSGGNGVYRYASASTFPNQTYQNTNFWVDVVFTSTVADTTPPTITTTTPAANASNVLTSTAVTVTFSEAMNPATITSSTFALRDPANNLVPATVSASGSTATLTPSTALAGGTTYTATVAGGSSGVKDLAGNALAATTSWSFTTAAPTTTCPCSIWPSTTTGGPMAADTSAVELGVKFRADSDGYITGIRFYKYSQNTGTHIGNLWTTSGTLLGSGTFTNESAAGWQQMSFATPIAITANTTYVASYFTPSGSYASTVSGLATAADNPPLHALADAAAGGNGVYHYGATSSFPTQAFSAMNYWVDVVYTPGPDKTAPTITAVSPGSGATNISPAALVRATFSEAMDPTSINTSTFQLRNASSTLIAATVSYDNTSRTASLVPTAALTANATYTATVSQNVTDTSGNLMSAPVSWSFTIAPPVPITQGGGGPILVVTSSSNPFTQYYAEILRAEGLNEFTVISLSSVTSSVLSAYDVVVLGEQALTSTQVTMFTNWVQGGGNLIALRPDKKLAALLGLSSNGTTAADDYMRIDTTTTAGAGLVGVPIQFHGTADNYVSAGAAVIAALYSDSTHATAFPAVTLNTVGAGQAAAFTYDLAKSIVYTRQGNPAWAVQERDGYTPIRPDDLFYGAKVGNIQPDYVDLDNVAIPQADEQQRLFANLILLMNADRRPLPRFWYFPNGEKAVVIMTGDDHGNGGTAGRMNQYLSLSPAGCNVANWECIRSSSYIYPNTPIGDAQVANLIAQGFDIGVHIHMASGQYDCGPDYTASTLPGIYSQQLSWFASAFPSAPRQNTNRTHCIMWSDWSSQASVEAQNGIRLDVNYYYWPPEWVNDVPGLFTGSGMPMRFATMTGTMIDAYQATTQMTDESGQTYPKTIDTLLGNALGPNGYYGAFTANMHTDSVSSPGSDAIVASAQANGVPIVSAKQMLTWLDGRNGSVFGAIGWNGSTLTFNVAPAAGSNGLQVMVPATFGTLHLSAITLNGAPVSFTTQTIKGIQYAFVTVAPGSYVATYVP